MLERFLRCDSFLWILLETSPDQVNQLRVFLNPVLFEIGDSFSYLRQIQVLNFLWFITNCHFIKDDAIGPHVHSWQDPSIICHFGCLVVLCADDNFHVALLAFGIDDMAQSEVTNFSHWTLLFILLLRFIFLSFLENEDIVDFDVCMNHASLMHIMDSV